VLDSTCLYRQGRTTSASQTPLVLKAVVRRHQPARNYRNAELDMHFSLSQDLTPLKVFLASARERGLHGLAVDLEPGEI
jgi:hypothetical protein